ncbi:DUF6359 domain-containing protein [Bacillus timonensis]|uniref:DUF6359 domain-containing protein n=1 Tax=Bacillus timonensis TaxID=1033734 RepID=UPI0002F43B0F|nr:DUF6359 domain-containing protein [Bacillus timonensis]
MKKRTARSFISLLAAIAIILSSFTPMLTSTVQAEENVITVAEAIANNSGSATVEGYVVGYANGVKSYDFEAPFRDDTNLLLADASTENEVSKILTVQVTKNFRSEFGLFTNPNNIGKKIRITGNLEPYFSVSGLKNPTAIEFTDGSSEPEPEPVPQETISIKDAKTKLGQKVQVEGIVTADNSAIGGGKLSTYIQDETAGVNIFAYDPATFPELHEGDRIKVIGKSTSYKGLSEIEPEIIEVLENGQVLPESINLSISDMQDASIAEPFEGSLINVNGFIKDIPSTPAGGGYNITFIDSEFNTTTLRVMEDSLDVTKLEAGKWYDVTGILSQYDSYQLIPRNKLIFS